MERTPYVDLRLEVQTPLLHAISALVAPDAATPRQALLNLLTRAVATVRDSRESRTLRALFGLDTNSSQLQPSVRRSAAAATWGVADTTFRRAPLKQLIALLAEQIAVLADAYGQGTTVEPQRPEPQPALKKERIRSAKLHLKIGQTLGHGGVYEIRDPRGTVRGRGTRAAQVGTGGSGEVYCAMFKNAQLRAIKFLTLTYHDPDRTGQRTEDFQATFAQEVRTLYPLSHANIARLHDSDTYIDDEGTSWDYLVTEFIAGPRLDEAIRDQARDGDEIYRILIEIADAISYLHRNYVYHCDIKYENIRLRHLSTTASDAVLLDWGAAHVLPPEQEPTLALDDDRQLFISTTRITHRLHRGYLSRKITKEELREFLPQHDMHSLGILIRELLGPDDDQTSEARTRLQRVIGRGGIMVLDEITADLLAAPEAELSADTGRGYHSMEHVLHDLRKLHPNYLSPVGTPELSLAAEFQFSLPTATGRGVLTPRLGRVLNHKMLQRLRDVPQLEYSSLKFLGATHSRLSHSTAVLRNARYYLAHLLNDARFRRIVEPQDLQAALLIALLHDLGHYQLSHMFEDFAADQRVAPGAKSWSGIEFDIPTDDDLFLPLVALDDAEQGVDLRGRYGTVAKEAIWESRDRLNSTYWDEGRPFKSLKELIIEDFGFATYDALVAIHRTIYARQAPADPNPAHLVLGAVISSEIDADKAAYLVEDAMRAGVPYGEGVDLDGILGSLCMPTAADMESANRPVIGIIRSGVTAARSISVNRNAMLNRVYWNPNNRAATAMVKYTVGRLLLQGGLDMPAFVGDALFKPREVVMAGLVELHRTHSVSAGVVPMAGLLEGERRIYKRLFETNALPRNEAEDISEAMLRWKYDDIIAVEDELVQQLRRDSAFRSVQDGDLVVDIPVKERDRPSGERGGKVFVYGSKPSSGRGELLSDATPVIKALKDEHTLLNRVCRVFIAPNRIVDEQSLERGSKLIHQFLKSRAGL